LLYDRPLFLVYLQDEAAYHGSGISLFDEQALTDSEFKYIIEMMSQFMQMVTALALLVY
jgi:hypothetical protein